MKALKNFIERYVLSDTLPVQARRVNMIFVIGMCGVILDEIIQVFFRIPNMMAILFVGFIFVGVTVFMYVANRFKIFRLTIWGILVLVFDIIFPVNYFLLGGMESGMSAFFVLSVVVTFVLTERMMRITLLIIHFAVIIVCYYVDFTNPDFSTQLIGIERVVDQIQAIVVTGACLGLLNMFQMMIEAREREKALRNAQAKTDFLANMSHEIRTPLNAVIGMTSIGKNSPDPDRKDYCFGRIEDASSHLLGVINDILDMSKIEANKLELSNVPFVFETMMQHVVNVSTFRIDEKQQHFMVYLDDKIPPLLVGDDQRIAQVLTNLLSNAVKFTPQEGSISLDVRVEEETEKACTLRFEVQDTGIGISDEQKSRLFTSFQQADNSTSRNFGGTGLGLAISKRIVEMMGGTIWIISEVGQGSSFIFTAKLERVAKEDEADHKKKRGGVNFKNLRILFVDDDQTVREYFSEIATRFGFAYDTAEGGQEALALIQQKGPYDFYFVDLRMPGMNGVELSAEIRKSEGDQNVIVMISSYELSEVEEEAKKAGVNHFLSKPLFPSAIADIIAESIGVGTSAEYARETLDETDIFKGYCVLLAEDVEINREIVLALLEPMALEIDIAVNGRDAFEKFRETPDRYDLILMDVQMPEMDGYEATQSIRAMELSKAKDIPIIAMTANVFREDVERCLAVGMNQHVGKPLDFAEVVSVLRKYLKSAD